MTLSTKSLAAFINEDRPEMFMIKVAYLFIRFLVMEQHARISMDYM